MNSCIFFADTDRAECVKDIQEDEFRAKRRIRPFWRDFEIAGKRWKSSRLKSKSLAYFLNRHLTLISLKKKTFILVCLWTFPKIHTVLMKAMDMAMQKRILGSLYKLDTIKSHWGHWRLLEGQRKHFDEIDPVFHFSRDGFLLLWKLGALEVCAQITKSPKMDHNFQSIQRTLNTHMTS